MWEKEIEVAKEAALKAGEAIMATLQNGFSIRKKGSIDLLTDADISAERILCESLLSEFPSDQILSEEAGNLGKSSERVWIVDPLDGTTNFAHGLQFVSVSIGLQVQGEYVLGVVYNPFLNELFEARKGTGAYLNQTPIRVSETPKLQDALLVTGFPYYVKERPERVLGLFRDMVLKAQGIRRLGSAAIDLCYVAMGRFDGFWEEGLKPWDTAAGLVILLEAGGQITDYWGKSFDPFQDTLLASNGAIHDELLRVINTSLVLKGNGSQ